MAKKSVATGVVEPKTDAEKLAELVKKPSKGVEIPNIPVETAAPPAPAATAMPSIPKITPEDLRAALEANPDVLRAAYEAKFGKPATQVTKRVYHAGVANAVPTARKSAQREGFIEISFDQKPDEATRTVLKNAGYRWSKFNSVWYGPAATLTGHERFGAAIQAALVS